MKINYDDWQLKFLETKGNKQLCTGRQVGKTEVCAKDAGDFATSHSKATILMIAPTERQAGILFEKTLAYLFDNFKLQIKTGKDRPTKSKIELKNNTKIICIPCGSEGTGIRGYTIHRLYADEASRIPENVWSAVTPQLLTTGGDMILLSTPFGREGFFFNMWKSDNFSHFYANSEEVIRNRKISDTWSELQREHALKFLADEKLRMTRMEYQQEYVGEFVEDLMQLFKDELIRKCQTLKPQSPQEFHTYFLGVDIGGRGGDESVFTIIDRTDRKLLEMAECIIENYDMTTMSERQILHLDNNWNFKKIYIDDGGMGVGVFDHLIEIDQTKRKTIPINNARRALDKDEDRKKKLLKEDLYNNLLCLMERGEIKLLDNPEIFQSLKSVQFEYTDSKEMKIFGNYTHIAESLIRAAWCHKDKSLNPFVA